MERILILFACLCQVSVHAVNPHFRTENFTDDLLHKYGAQLRTTYHLFSAFEANVVQEERLLSTSFFDCLWMGRSLLRKLVPLGLTKKQIAITWHSLTKSKKRKPKTFQNVLTTADFLMKDGDQVSLFRLMEQINNTEYRECLRNDILSSAAFKTKSWNCAKRMYALHRVYWHEVKDSPIFNAKDFKENHVRLIEGTYAQYTAFEVALKTLRDEFSPAEDKDFTHPGHWDSSKESSRLQVRLFKGSYRLCDVA